MDGAVCAVRPECLKALPRLASVPAIFEELAKDPDITNVRGGVLFTEDGEEIASQHGRDDELDMDISEAAFMSMLHSMNVSVPSNRSFTQQEAWTAAHDSNPDPFEVARSRAHAHGEALTLDDIPEHMKDWRNFM